MRKILLILILLIASTQVYSQAHKLSFKSMFEQLGCMDTECFTKFAKSEGFVLDTMIERGTNFFEYTFTSTHTDYYTGIAYNDKFIVGQNAKNEIVFYMLKTANEALYKSLFDDMLNNYSYKFAYNENGFNYYDSAITKKQAAIFNYRDPNSIEMYYFMLYNREN